ncbi:thaumatin [Zychaea mexicana]|uniref:thaumatin n=1 Tax=Zychaea mexicana TaxID=64656 RepID=UPI0022FEC0A3|nr:thaumatin [Zychaea mexicana]XP_052978254.1 thaumatin [Zychaea mexicana]KAI9491988.1 thaumatin [Zychaea mexicana]KAI9491989.1 thaumatin [Zychaea mexicana]
MYTSLKLVSVAALLGLVAAAPASDSSSGGGVKIVIKNQCDYDLNIGKLDNGASSPETADVAKGASKTYSLDSKWQGRFWGREAGDENPTAGAADPASLAEFTFKGYGNNDYYDVSFVDGYNIPIRIDPINGDKSGGADNGEHYLCGAPTCSSLPACPDELKVMDNGEEVGCKSACSEFNTEEYCCFGSMDTPETCPANEYSKDVKDACPDVYTYAYDDPTSTFMCRAEGYTVTFCPSS